MYASPRGEEVKIDGRLIKTAAPADFPCAVIAHLHLKDEPRTGGIGDEYVETNTLALVRALERIFVFDVDNILHLDAEYPLDEMLANAFVAHDELEHVIVGDGQIPPFFALCQGASLLVPILP